ncbi:hypothetical protein KI387_016349, partial [Taxus chinensis]
EAKKSLMWHNPKANVENNEALVVEYMHKSELRFQCQSRLSCSYVRPAYNIISSADVRLSEIKCQTMCRSVHLLAAHSTNDRLCSPENKAQ